MQIDSTILSVSVDNALATGDVTLIAAVAGKTIHVIDMVIATGASVVLIFKNGATALTGAMTVNGTLVLPENPNSEWFATTTPANSFVMNVTGAVQVSGIIHYFLL